MAKTRTQSPLAARQYQLVNVDDLTGGVDLRRTASNLPTDRARTIRNFSLGEIGALKVDYGYTQHSSASLGAGRIQGAERVYLSSNVFTLAAWSGALYKPTDAGVWGAAVGSSLSTGTDVFFPHDRDLVAVLDGTNRPFKSGNAGAGSSWTIMGIDGPSSGATVSSVSTGTFIGGSEYEVTYAYVDDELGHASNESTTVSTYTMGSSGGISVVVSNSTDPQVDTIYVYCRNVTAGDSIRRRAASKTQSTGANSTVSITSTNWTANAEAPTNHDVPLAWAFGVVWKNRWWMRHPTIKNRLHFSELFQPQSFPALYYVDIPFQRGDEIKALATQGDTLVVFGGTKPFLVIGQTSLDFDVKPSLGDAGALGPRAVVALENGVIHASYQGVHIFDGATDRLLSFDIDDGWRDLISNTANADLQKIALTYHDIRKEIRVSVPRLFPLATPGEWILDLNRTRLTEESAWTSTPRSLGGYIPWNGNESAAGNQGRLFSWDSTVGLLWEESVGTAANGSNLTAVYEGPTLTTGRHRSRWIDTYHEFRQSAGTLTSELFVDGLSQGAQTVDIGGSIILYGDSTYTYGDSSRVVGAKDRTFAILKQPLGADGYAAKEVLTYVGQDAYKHYTYAHGFVPETKPRGF